MLFHLILPVCCRCYFIWYFQWTYNLICYFWTAHATDINLFSVPNSSGDFILQISIHVLLVTALHRKFHLWSLGLRLSSQISLHVQLALQISFQIIIHRFHVKIANFISVGNSLVRFYFILVTYSIMDESLSLWLSLQLLLPSHISFQLLLTLQISFQLIIPFRISSHFPLPCQSFFPTHPYQKV